jgi:hypothetical protein
MLQARPAAVRQVLIDALAQIDDKRATRALARRALLDLHPRLRESAARALEGRPREGYEPVLLSGLRYPWSPAATHAAEALVFLDDRHPVPQLELLLRQPDPRLPFTARLGDKETLVVREVVRINHQNNCMLCHPPVSGSGKELVQGWVPGSERTPKRAGHAPAVIGFGFGYGIDFQVTSVHADTTYLKQDFSVTQPAPLDLHGGPSEQRFDYLVRVRRATPQELQLLGEANVGQFRSEAREAVLFALREITGREYPPEKAAVAARP